MPETLLKKRKSQEKERAEKAEQREARKKVGRPRHPAQCTMMKEYPTQETSFRAMLSS